MKFGSDSILGRIIWLHVVALGVVFAAISLAAWLLLRATAGDFQQRLLLDHAQNVASHLNYANGAWTLALPPDLEVLYGRGYAGYALSVLDDRRQVVYTSLPQSETLIPSVSRTDAPSFFTEDRGEATFFGVDFPVRRAGHVATIQVAQDLQNADVIVDDVVQGFVRRLAWILLPLFALMPAMDVLIVRRALKPITRASQLARSIQPGAMGVRLPEAGVPKEVLPLVEAINQALERLEKGFETQRDFTADAAHELRTPLAILTTMIDVLPDRRAAEQLRPHIHGMNRIVGQLLELAELESSTLGGEEVADLRAVCSEAVSVMAPIAVAGGKSIELSAPGFPVWVQGNGEMLFRAVRNLIENAVRYTPSDTVVEVEVAAAGSVSVKDRGPGIPEADRELIFRRFWRRDRRTGASAGLGLSIVQRAIQIHGGEVEVGTRDGGGAVFSITFPAQKLITSSAA